MYTQHVNQKEVSILLDRIDNDFKGRRVEADRGRQKV